MTGITRRGYFHLKNRMLFANLMSNAVGVGVVLYLSGHSGLSSFSLISETSPP
jgi:hypothetical protein